MQGLDCFSLAEGELTWQRDALYLIWLAGVSLQFAFGYRLGLPQVEEREPVAHRRLLGFSGRPFAATTHKTKGICFHVSLNINFR